MLLINMISKMVLYGQNTLYFYLKTEKSNAESLTGTHTVSHKPRHLTLEFICERVTISVRSQVRVLSCTVKFMHSNSCGAWLRETVPQGGSWYIACRKQFSCIIIRSLQERYYNAQNTLYSILRDVNTICINICSHTG